MTEQYGGRKRQMGYKAKWFQLLHALTNGTLTERDDYDTGTYYETRGISDQVSQ